MRIVEGQLRQIIREALLTEAAMTPSVAAGMDLRFKVSKKMTSLTSAPTVAMGKSVPWDLLRRTSPATAPGRSTGRTRKLKGSDPCSTIS